MNCWNESIVGVGFGLLDVGVLCGEPAAANDDQELLQSANYIRVQYVSSIVIDFVGDRWLTWLISGHLDPCFC